jgi:hypothetical protein
MCIADIEMPEHDLEPPKFSRRALERILNDWTAVKAMIQSGKKQNTRYNIESYCSPLRFNHIFIIYLVYDTSSFLSYQKNSSEKSQLMYSETFNFFKHYSKLDRISFYLNHPYKKL